MNATAKKLTLIIGSHVTGALSGLRSVGSAIGGLAAGAVKWGGLALFGGITIAAGLAARAIVRLGSVQEQTRIAFDTMMGSVAAGNAMLTKLQQFANVTPFDTAEVVQAGRSLLAYGVEAGKVMPLLRRIGDVSAGTGKALGELSAIFGKVYAKGKMDTEALNQMTEAGIPMVKVLGQQFGVSGAKIYEMAEKGKLTADVVEKAFETMTGAGGMFEGLMEKQSTSVGGMWSTLMGKLSQSASDLGEQLAPVMAKVLEYLTGWVDKLGEFVSDGRAANYLAQIGVVGVAAIGEVIKAASWMTNNTIAAAQTIGAAFSMIWSGVKTGFWGVVTAVTAAVETMINGILLAYNAVVGVFGKKGVEINWNATKSMAKNTADAAGDTATAAGDWASGKYFDRAMGNYDETAASVDAMVGKISNGIAKWNENTQNTLTKRASVTSAPDLDTTKKAVADLTAPKLGKEKTSVDDMTKVGLYNFGGAALRSLDQERNKLLRAIVDKLDGTVEPQTQTILA